MKAPTGMTAFSIVWFGQIISLLGSAMVGFAIPIYVFTLTGRATDLALLGVAFMVPLLITSTVAGAVVDRNNLKLMMMLSDLGAGISSVILLILVLTGNFSILVLYPLQMINGAFQSFQWPAYSTAISTMLPKQHYGRANGMLSLAESGSGIFAPVLGAAMLANFGLEGILIIDIITFSFAVLTLLIVKIPQPVKSEEGEKAKGNLISEALYGLRFILARPSLLGLQLVFLFGNFIVAIGRTLNVPMVLARTNNSEQIMGFVMSAGAVGGVLGGILMSTWGGPKKRVHGVIFGWFLSAVLTIMFGLGRNVWVWGAASLLTVILFPIMNGSNQAIWQSKVPPDLQGRVFSMRRLIAWVATPLSALIAGPLADFVMEPAMAEGGALAETFGWLVGVGPGAGMALTIVLMGALVIIVPTIGILFRAIRDAEDILPDHAMVDTSKEVGGDIAPAPAASD